MTGFFKDRSQPRLFARGGLKIGLLIVVPMIVVLGVVFFKFAFTEQPGGRGGASRIQMKAGINNSLKSAPLVIADKTGCFKRRGLAVTLVRESSSSPLLERMLSGELDIVCVPEQLVAFLAMERSDFRIVGVVNRNQSQELIINTARHVYSPFGLKGHRIGLDMNSAAPYFLYRKLLFYNLSLDDVELVDVRPDLMADKMAAGEIDAAIVWPPFSNRILRRLGQQALVTNAHIGRDMYWLMVARKDWCRDHVETLESFFAALEEAFDYMASSPQKAMSLAGRYFGFSPERVSQEWDTYHFDLELPQSLLFAMEQEARWWQRRMHVIGSTPDFFNLIDSQPLKNMFPDKVSIIQ